MSGLLSVVGFVGLLLALLGVCRGSVRSLGLRTRSQCAKTAVAAFAVVLVGGALAPDPPPAADPVAQQKSAPAAPESVPSPRATTVPPPPAPAPARSATTTAPQRKSPPSTSKPAPATAPLLTMAAGGDGDSWRDTSGVEYRMGLVNTPETNECGGAAATAYRKRALAAGFRAKPYATDGYGRTVSVILAANGVNLNVAMARDGIANDRYLERFRHENPALASQLDAAFREARAAGRGIWTTCSAAAPAPEPVAPQPVAPQSDAGSGCHPDYTTCIPVVGDGSGRGAANDLDCGEIGRTVHLRQIGRDPYRLDGNDKDGIGCE